MSSSTESMVKRFGIGALILTSALAGGACGGGSDTQMQQGNICTALPPLAMKSTYRVGFVQVAEDNPWRNANTASIMDEAAKRHYTLEYTPGTSSGTGTTADPSEQVARMQALIDAKVDAIILAPHDETIVAPSVVAARRACIPVFVEDRDVDHNIAIPGVDYVS